MIINNPGLPRDNRQVVVEKPKEEEKATIKVSEIPKEKPVVRPKKKKSLLEELLEAEDQDKADA